MHCYHYSCCLYLYSLFIRELQIVKFLGASRLFFFINSRVMFLLFLFYLLDFCWALCTSLTLIVLFLLLLWLFLVFNILLFLFLLLFILIQLFDSLHVFVSVLRLNVSHYRKSLLLNTVFLCCFCYLFNVVLVVQSLVSIIFHIFLCFVFVLINCILCIKLLLFHCIIFI